MKIETHIHPHNFKSEFDRLIDTYLAASYDGILVTEHFHGKQFRRMTFSQWAAPVETLIKIVEKRGRPLRIFTGAEITCSDGNDYLCAGLTLSSLCTLAESKKHSWRFRAVADFVHGCGGILIQAHPLREKRGRYVCSVNLNADGFEVNNPHHENHNEIIRRLARDLQKIQTSGSDAHRFRHCCKASTSLEKHASNGKELVTQLKTRICQPRADK